MFTVNGNEGCLKLLLGITHGHNPKPKETARPETLVAAKNLGDNPSPRRYRAKRRQEGCLRCISSDWRGIYSALFGGQPCNQFNHPPEPIRGVLFRTTRQEVARPSSDSRMIDR
ncbi:hypothetical protein CNMCM5793_004431 [Aspergillus hiratsukae]|uniref:Uncharacterized protein n=1 Tax=Aspergillus hiratsukae TaxID=1194566 RepID=A0A8H6PFH7_9EURO|nr:hypothetical protein CNMCM5793_004431 [Aspergillus hiratsukae]